MSSKTQDLVVELVAKSLSVDPAAIDINVPLMELGLDSVSVVILTGELEKILEIAIDPTVILGYPTIAGLSKHLESELSTAS